ncbi:hypothetical protein ACFVQ9_16910 [Streptomyces goshikiensis]|uniref:hypothetical protein n=1 Tax=Streptomyces goshikiensis TaxID=1942 RepID=UPI0036C4AF63
MKVGVFVIVPDLVSPEKSSPARFGMVRTFGDFHVTEQASPIRHFAAFGQEVALPVGSHDLILSTKSVRPLVSGGVREGVVPCGGTGSKILARLAGAIEVLATARPLSTGVVRKAAEMISICSIRAVR